MARRGAHAGSFRRKWVRIGPSALVSLGATAAQVHGPPERGAYQASQTARHGIQLVVNGAGLRARAHHQQGRDKRDSRVGRHAGCGALALSKHLRAGAAVVTQRSAVYAGLSHAQRRRQARNRGPLLVLTELKGCSALPSRGSSCSSGSTCVHAYFCLCGSAGGQCWRTVSTCAVLGEGAALRSGSCCPGACFPLFSTTLQRMLLTHPSASR